MTLPIRTTLEDVNAVCGYLMTKPTGASLPEARAVVDKKHLDGRKLTALKFWGLIEDHENKMRITEAGRQSVRDYGAYRNEVMQSVVRQVPPYIAVIERTVHRNEGSLTATEVAAHWHEHFSGEVAESDKILNDQAVCFFQIAQGADLGALVIGRNGKPTRFEFHLEVTRALVGGTNVERQDRVPLPAAVDEVEPVEEVEPEEAVSSSLEGSGLAGTPILGNRVFITHGKNITILDQVKQIVTFGKFEPVVAMEHETLAKPVPQKVMDDMRTCSAAVIHVSADRILYERDGTEVPTINENVLIEIGAAMALYNDRFILLVEEGVKLPSNLQGLYECRYQGNELSGAATMKLLETFNEFGA